MHDGVIVLDGGMGQELIRRADAEPTPLWSTQVMLDQPELVRRVHADFIAAGAEIITANAYCATRCRLEPAGLGAHYEPLQLAACELANDARGDRDDVLVAGCLSPYGWSYRPELAPPFDELAPQYAESAALQAPHVDLIICETMGSIDEARAAVTGASAAGKPVWVSWTLHDDHRARLRSGETLADAVAALAPLQPEAMLVNCSIPEAFATAMPVLAAGTGRFGGYANGFGNSTDEYHPGSLATTLGQRHDLGPAEYADVAVGWIGQGATIVGGCCEIGPSHIAELARRLGR